METQKTERKKTNAGKTGLTLSAAIFVLSLIFIPFQVSCFYLILIPIACLGFIASLIFCIYGLLKNRNRNLAGAGLLVIVCTLISLFFVFITFTPPGSVPYPLNIYKFKRALECDFWLDYDKEHIINVQSQNTVLISKQGAIHFQSEPNTYQKESVIKYAENNGWKYHLSVKLTEEDLKTNWDWDVINSLRPSPILLKKDCTVLVFETGHIHGMASYIMISEDLSEMVVFFYNASLPDPAMKFWIPEGYKELNKIQSEQEEPK